MDSSVTPGIYCRGIKSNDYVVNEIAHAVQNKNTAGDINPLAVFIM